MARTSRKQQASLSQFRSEQSKLYHTAIYARLSVEDNGKGSDSIESQIAYLEDFIATDPTLRKAAVYVDNGFTGTNFMRPEFRRMIDAARRGEINCVVVKDLSRLGRNYVETGEFLEKICPFLNLRFIAVNDHYDSAAASGSSQLAAALSNILNDFYARDISRKVCSALKTRMENGDYIGAWEKYGYLKDPDNKNRLIVNPETAPVVQQIFRWRSEGMSYMGINKKLNAQGVLSPGQYKAERGIVTNNNQKARKILWNRHIITDILKDITYTGHLAQRKTTQCLSAGIGCRRVDESEWIVVRSTHEPIISQELFDRVQEINQHAAAAAKANRGKYDGLPKAGNIYGKKLVCADCGAAMKLVRSFSRNRDKAYFTFQCSTYAEHGKAGCSGKSRRKADLDEAVFRAIRAQMDVFLETTAVIQALLAQKQTVHPEASKTQHKASAAARLKALRSQIAALYLDWKDGLLTAEEYRMLKEAVQAQIAGLARDEPESEDRLTCSRKWAGIVEAYSDAAGLSEGLLHACVERIRVHADGSLDITFNYAQEFTELLETAERLKQEVA